jgi:DNA-binding PadR family transcriptional regulator
MRTARRHVDPPQAPFREGLWTRSPNDSVTTASTTSLLDTLERSELVTRLPDPADRRWILVAITDAGRQMFDDFLPQVVALQSAALARLTAAARPRSKPRAD